ncbi:MAG: hypothetical protein ACXVLT_03315 [Flavisolibacter sp.]
MARIFNICFDHKEKTYSALVSVNGDDETPIQVTTGNDQIHIMLPTGRLSISVSDVLQRMYATVNNSANTTVHVTPNISLQLLNTDW